MERRLKVATEEETKQFGAAFKLEYMSEDEDTSGGDGQPSEQDEKRQPKGKD